MLTSSTAVGVLRASQCAIYSEPMQDFQGASNCMWFGWEFHLWVCLSWRLCSRISKCRQRQKTESTPWKGTFPDPYPALCWQLMDMKLDSLHSHQKMPGALIDLCVFWYTCALCNDQIRLISISCSLCLLITGSEVKIWVSSCLTWMLSCGPSFGPSRTYPKKTWCG